MRFVFLGPPGAGKGTQAVMVSQRHSLPVIATGGIFREAIAKGTSMGRQIAQFVNAGLLVPDQLTNAIVAARLKEKDCKKGFILDGYPRSLVQAKALDLFLLKAHRPIDGVLYFKVDAGVVIERMSQRRICSQCGQTFNLTSRPPMVEAKCDQCASPLVVRSDDHPEAIRKRLELYEENTSPILQFYDRKGSLKVVNASLPVQEVTQLVMALCL